MILFACDSSGRTASAALVRDGALIAERFVDEGLTHSETLLPLCDDLFQEAGLTPRDVDAFAVTTGPGSFTGLRIGVGLVKGMAFAVGRPCVPVPTLEAYAYSDPDFDGVAVPVCDARRERVYTAGFGTGGGRVTQLAPDAVLPNAALSDLFPPQKNILLVGDAAQLCYTIYKDSFPVHIGATALRARWVAAAALTRLAGGQTVSASDLRPDYLQLSQAERERQKRQQQGGQTP